MKTVDSKSRSRLQFLRTAALSAMLTVVVGGAVAGQQTRISGTVTSTGGAPLRGAVVRVQGGDTVTTTNDQGRYTITAQPTATLTFTYVGYRPHESPVNNRTTINVVLERLALLEQVVVT